MRLTDQAKEASANLHTPEGLDPSLIGRVVEIKIFRKKDGEILTESLNKHVGILKNYTQMPQGILFTLEGAPEYSVFYSNSSVEFHMPTYNRK